MDERYASIRVVEGGYIVNIADKDVVTTSFQKAIGMIRDHVAPKKSDEE